MVRVDIFFTAVPNNERTMSVAILLNCACCSLNEMINDLSGASFQKRQQVGEGCEGARAALPLVSSSIKGLN